MVVDEVAHVDQSVFANEVCVFFFFFVFASWMFQRHTQFLWRICSGSVGGGVENYSVVLMGRENEKSNSKIILPQAHRSQMFDDINVLTLYPCSLSPV